MGRLPDPTEPGLAPFPDCVVAVRVPTDGLTVFRLVRTVPATEDDFGVSRTAALAVTSDSAERVRRRLSSRIAQLHLTPDPLVHLARTGTPVGGNHVSVWGPRKRLLRAVVTYR